MRQLAASTLALALGAGAAFVLVSCGGGEDAKLLPGNTAQEITENLDRVKQYAEEGECVGAEDAVAEVNSQVEGLTGVDPKLVAALERGAGRLSEVIATCEEEPLETTESTEETTEPALPPGQEKKEEKEREKEEKALEHEEAKQEKHEPPAPPETTPAEPPAPPGEGGGTPSPGGVGPGTAVESEGGD